MENKTNTLVLAHSQQRYESIPPWRACTASRQTQACSINVHQAWLGDTNIIHFHPLCRFLTLSQPPGSPWPTAHATTPIRPKNIVASWENLCLLDDRLQLSSCQVITIFKKKKKQLWTHKQIWFFYNCLVFQNESIHKENLICEMQATAQQMSQSPHTFFKHVKCYFLSCSRPYMFTITEIWLATVSYL